MSPVFRHAGVAARLVPVARVFSGPNCWSRRPTLELAWSWEELERLAACRDELERRLSRLGVGPVPPAEGEPVEAAGAVEARWIAETLVRMQTAAECEVSYRGWRSAPEGAWRVAVEFEEERIARGAAALLHDWIDRLAGFGRSDDGWAEWKASWERFLEEAYDARLGNSTRGVVRAARRRGIPWLRLDDESLVQLGQGARQRRIEGATTDRTGRIAERTATNKSLTKRLLAAIGIPVPTGREAASEDEAVEAALALGWPVVVKPIDADYGDGVSIRLTDPDAVRAAYATARRFSERVLVESFVPGTLYRMLVVDGRLTSVVRRESAFVAGDGQSTIGRLVALANQDPRRGPGPDGREIDFQQFEPMGTPGESRWALHGEPDAETPAAGRTVALRRDIFLRQGGYETERVADVHPEFAQLASDAARVAGLDVAGLDVIVQDVADSPWRQNWAVLEVNPQPALVLHRRPLCATDGDACEAIVDSLFRPGDAGRIPLIAVLGYEEADREARRIAERHAGRGRVAAMASRTGAWLEGRRLTGSSEARVADQLDRLWRHPRTEVVVVHLTPEDLLRDGVPFEQCDAIYEIGAEHVGAVDSAPADDWSLVLNQLRATRVEAPATRVCVGGAPPQA